MNWIKRKIERTNLRVEKMVEIQPLEKDRYRVFLTPDEFKSLLQSVPHHRARPPILIMALSARVGTAAEVTPGQFLKKNGEYFLRVEGKDASDRYQETKPRNMWIPQPVYDDINCFIDDNNIADDEPICDVGKRQLQNWVKTTAKNTEIKLGIDDIGKLSPHDLRRYFGTHFLIRLQFPQQYVCQLGGWKSPEHMYEYLLVPNDLLVHRLKKEGYTGTNPLFLSGTDVVEELNANFDTLEDILSDDSFEAHTEAKKRIKELVERFDSLSLTVTHTLEDSANGDSDDEGSIQTSFTGSSDFDQ